MSLPPATDFMFVNIARPQDMNDKKTRKRINSHVMKPIGAARRCNRSGQKIQLILKSTEAASQVAEIAQRPALPDIETPNPVHPSPETFPSAFKLAPSLPPYERPTSYPMSNRTARILHFLCAADEAPVCKMMRELCFALAFIDDSAMHLVLARLEIDPERTGGKPSRDNTETLSHYNASIEILRSQLGEPGLIAHEIIIGVVVNLACYDIFTNNLQRWKTHMLGLQTMISYRGGIGTLSSQYLQVTATWTDLIGSMILDETPYFTPQQGNEPISSHMQYDYMEESTGVVPESCNDISPLLNLLLKLSNLATGKPELQLREDSALLEALQATVYTTLTLPRYESLGLHNNSSKPQPATYELVRLAILAYLSGPVMFLAGNMVLNVIASHYRGRISRLYDPERLNWAGLEHAELFVLVTGALIEEGSDRYWLLGHLRRIMLSQDLRWNDLVACLNSIAWFDVVWIRGLEKLRTDLATMDGNSVVYRDTFR
ncbi:uncharacterized protein FTOL_02009 [Fusarium torulosum]|uniref:Uncharacterized protein n=1 Tax=Fusarium torulosum TaxID=33205 RepID=A0AAE8M0Z7_9HYPO|nr:uncharacterized protein FTOL_02009 [Fusarium torulosum]